MLYHYDYYKCVIDGYSLTSYEKAVCELQTYSNSNDSQGITTIDGVHSLSDDHKLEEKEETPVKLKETSKKITFITGLISIIVVTAVVYLITGSIMICSGTVSAISLGWLITMISKLEDYSVTQFCKDNTNKIIYTFFVFIILFFGVLTLNYLEILEMNLYTIISGITVFIVAICYIWKIMKDTENAITLGTKIGQLILLCYNSFKEVKT
jgi:hypothetical protein